MPAQVAIDARGLGKSFAIHAHPSDLLREVFGGRPRHRLFRALHEVTFAVRAGESVGVLGRNGAGKSTLLKIVAGTLEPSAGSVRVQGRVSAILELGTGFDGSQTGRSNVIMGALCLGMGLREARSKLDAIVDFAELREFIDQPLRTYSTGMVARLAFSVAVSVDPAILIVDEALSVGDARFQLRCADRFRQFRREGRTILLVSHSTEQVTTMCDRAIVLERGELVIDAASQEATRRYHQLLFGGGLADAAFGAAPALDPVLEAAPEEEEEAFDPGPPPPEGELDAGTRMGDGGATVERVAILDARGRDVRRLVPGRRYTLLFEARCHADYDDLAAGFLFRDPSGQTIYGLDTREGVDRWFALAAGQRVRVRMPFLNTLGPGHYFVSFGLARADERKLDFCCDAVHVEVPLNGGIYHASRADLAGQMQVEPLAAEIEAVREGAGAEHTHGFGARASTSDLGGGS